MEIKRLPISGKRDVVFPLDLLYSYDDKRTVPRSRRKSVSDREMLVEVSVGPDRYIIVLMITKYLL